jgi:hypothetical protein
VRFIQMWVMLRERGLPPEKLMAYAVAVASTFYS